MRLCSFLSSLLKVLSYWNLSGFIEIEAWKRDGLKVLSYWNLNKSLWSGTVPLFVLKVLSYWNLNTRTLKNLEKQLILKYYHIGI